MTLEEIAARAGESGLALTGAFRPGPADGVPDGAAALLLFGYGGPALWAAFRASAEASDGAPHPLDRWSRRVIGGLARECGGRALFPFDGPPYHPFIRWTYAAEPLHRSKLGMAIHEEKGLWCGWRGAVALFGEIDLPAPSRVRAPCDECPMPCRAACPVSAFTDAGYDAARCRAHISSPAGGECRARGCLARVACPVGAGYAQVEAQAAFHLEAFRIA